MDRKPTPKRDTANVIKFIIFVLSFMLFAGMTQDVHAKSYHQQPIECQELHAKYVMYTMVVNMKALSVKHGMKRDRRANEVWAQVEKEIKNCGSKSERVMRDAHKQGLEFGEPIR